MRQETRVVLTGATGQVGGYAALFLARLGVADVLYVASRSAQAAATVLHNARACALFRESATLVQPLTLDLLDAGRTAETLAQIRPTLVLNVACLLSLYAFFPALRKRQGRLGMVAGFAHTLPKDLAVLWPLMRAVREGSPGTLVLNMAAPDTAHAMLARLDLSPTVGAGTIDSTAQGIRIGAARILDVHPRRVTVSLVCHHVIRRAPIGTVPYHLRVFMDGRDVTERVPARDLLAEAVDVTGVETMSTPVTSNAAITAASAVETARAILQDSGEIRHGAGAEGWLGGTPVRLRRHGAKVELPDGVSAAQAREINLVGVRATGVEAIHDDGSVRFTEPERLWLEHGLGLSWKVMRLEDARAMSGELEAAYRRMRAEEEGAP